MIWLEVCCSQAVSKNVETAELSALDCIEVVRSAAQATQVGRAVAPPPSTTTTD